MNPWGINPTGTAIKRVKPETGESIPLGPIFELNQDMALILRNARAYAGYESIEDPNTCRQNKNCQMPLFHS